MTEETKTHEENTEQNHAKMEPETTNKPSKVLKWTKRVLVGGVVLSVVTVTGVVISKLREIEITDI